MNILILLCPIIAFGSFVDAIAGGGGLITLTAYVALGLPPQTALGNNKFASASGTLIASIQYLRKSQGSLSIASVATLFSFIGSVVGSFLATRYADTYLNYLLVILVPAVALFMVFKPDFGQAKEKSRLLLFSLASITGLVIGA